MAPQATATAPIGSPSPGDEVAPSAALRAPAAVRLVELTAPLVDIQLPQSTGGRPYRSLLALPRLQDGPIGAATLPVDRSGLVSRHCLERELRSQLGGDMREALARRDLATPGAETPTRTRSVSVVVTTCCSPVALERCLRSILQSDHGDLEVIVVENRPRSPATRRMLTERFPGEPRLRYVEEPRQGLSRARNAGLAVAGGDVVAFTDDDVVVDPAWVGRCANAFDRGSDVACVTGLSCLSSSRRRPSSSSSSSRALARAFDR